MRSKKQVPLGSWPLDPRKKEIGRYAQLGFGLDVEGFILLLASAVGWSKEEILVYASHFRRELRNPKYHGYYKQKAVWGRKPE